MNCNEANQLLWDYHDRRLIKELDAALENHLHSCNACKQKLRHITSVTEMIKEERMKTPDPFFVAKVMDRIHENTAEPERLRLLSVFTSIRPELAAMAVFLSIATGIFLGLPAANQPVSEEYETPIDAFAGIYGLQVEENGNFFEDLTQ